MQHLEMGMRHTDEGARRIAAVGESPLFRACLGRIDAAEADRAFCRHGLPHALDVARIAWILNLERAYGLSRDVVYAAGLLHDVGRAGQYATGEDHDVAGVRIAEEILDALPEHLRLGAGERAAILEAVGGHRGACGDGARADARDDGARADTLEDAQAGARDAGVQAGASGGGALAALIKEADNRSRACFACPVRDACHWTDERKNLSLDI